MGFGWPAFPWPLRDLSKDPSVGTIHWAGDTKCATPFNASSNKLPTNIHYALLEQPTRPVCWLPVASLPLPFWPGVLPTAVTVQAASGNCSHSPPLGCADASSFQSGGRDGASVRFTVTHLDAGAVVSVLGCEPICSCSQPQSSSLSLASVEVEVDGRTGMVSLPGSSVRGVHHTDRLLSYTRSDS